MYLPTRRDHYDTEVVVMFFLSTRSPRIANPGTFGILAGETCAMSTHSTKHAATHEAMMTSCAGPSTVDPPET